MSNTGKVDKSRGHSATTQAVRYGVNSDPGFLQLRPLTTEPYEARRALHRADVAQHAHLDPEAGELRVGRPCRISYCGRTCIECRRTSPPGA
jgi:hypothetical protein